MASDGLSIEELRLEPGELAPTVFEGHRLALQLNGPVRFEVLTDDRYRPLMKTPGGFGVTPAGKPVGLRWRTEQRTLLATVAPSFVARVLAEEREISGGGTLGERHGVDDPHSAHLLHALHADAQAGRPSGRLYTEALGRALVLRIAAGYISRPPSAERGLDPLTLARVCDYVEARLADDPSLADLARVAGLSPAHFARRFRKATGLPPHRYAVVRRLERAKILLATSDRPIAAIAFDLGFGSQGHFQRAFRRHVGATPGLFRRES